VARGISTETASPPAMNARISAPTEIPLPLACPWDAPGTPAALSPAVLPWLEYVRL
jgi:hypothetical protein